MTRARILIADDAVDMRRWLRLVLAPLDAYLHEVASGAELLLALREGSFDVVISDVWMPPPDGISAAATARTSGIVTPFIVITSCTSTQVRKDADRISDTTLLYKPLDQHALRARVTELLARQSPSLSQHHSAPMAGALLCAHQTFDSPSSGRVGLARRCPSCEAVLHENEHYCPPCRVQARPCFALDPYDDLGGSG